MQPHRFVRSRFLVRVWASPLGLAAWSSAVVLCGRMAQAQNLVPNPSFEVNTGIPTGLSQLSLATSWTSPTLGSPDYFHALAAGVSSVGVPVNGFGVEQPLTGSAYVGIHVRPVNQYREYVETPLSSPLVAGQPYRVSFNVSLVDQSQWAVDNIGAYLSVGAVGPVNTAYNLPFTPHVRNPAGSPITNKVGWTLITGVYVAAGGEDHLVIGNFADNPSTTAIILVGGSFPFAYYYLDDVSVTPEVLPCIAPPAGMVLWLSGDNYPTDLSGLGNHGAWQPNSSAAAYTNGKVKQAFDFSGPNAVRVNDSASLNFGAGDMSIDAWVQLKTDVNQGGFVVHKIDPLPGNTGYGLFIKNQALQFQFGNAISYVSNPLPYVVGTWHHVAATLDRTSGTPALKFYLDGAQVVSFTSPSGISLSNTADLFVGQPYASQIADLAIDELEVFNRVLSPAEVLAIFTAGSGGKCKCEPDPTGVRCKNAICPAGEQCVPTLMAYGLGTGPVLACGCEDPNECRVVLTPASKPTCMEPCPDANDECTLKGVDTDENEVNDQFWCDCVPAPPPTCRLPSDPDICESRWLEDCQDGDPDDFCRPAELHYDPMTGQFTALACECANPDQCYVALPPHPGLPPTCGGFVCAGTGESCQLTETQNADGTITYDCCPCAHPPEACCHRGGACTDIAPACCITQITGTPVGPGTSCQGPQACCLPDRTCLVMDEVCCLNAGGTPLGAESDCLGDVDSDGIDDACCDPVSNNDLVVDISTGVDDATSTLIPLAGNDDTWTVRCAAFPPLGPIPRPAVVIPQNLAWCQPFANSQWIGHSPLANAGFPQGDYCYSSCFCLKPGFDNASIQFSLRADNGADVYLHNIGPAVTHLLTAAPISSFACNTLTTYSSSDQALFAEGENCVELLVHNLGGATGFNLAGQITADDARCCCAPLADGSGCQQTHCAEPNLHCRPTRLVVEPGTGQLTVTQCDCTARGPCEGSCYDGRLCNGLETCDAVEETCMPGEPPCSEGSVCREVMQACVAYGSADAGDIADCLDGPSSPLKKGCIRFDLDDDGDCDLHDYNIFEQVFMEP